MADLSTALFQAKFERRGFLYSVLAILNRIALRAPDLVVASNEVYRRLAVRVGKRGPNSTIAIQSYPDHLPIARSTRPAGPLRIGYFGVLGSHDGVNVLLQAVARLEPPRLPEFELIVVGDGPALAGLRRLSKRLALDKWVCFRGFLDGAARDAAIASFDIAVIPDPINRYTRTISMNKAFVYAAQGLAIVATPLAGTKRLLGPAALFAEDDSPVALADAIHALLLDENKRRALGRAARTRAEKAFNWTGEALRYVAAVEALVPAHTWPQGEREQSAASLRPG